MQKYLNSMLIAVFAILAVFVLSGCSLTTEVSLNADENTTTQEETEPTTETEQTEETVTEEENQPEEEQEENNEENTEEETEPTQEVAEEPETSEEESPTEETVTEEENRFTENEEVVEVSLDKKFNIAGSSVSYSAAKKWLNKPVESVVGSNSKVTGGFTYNNGKLTGLSATVDSQAFSTGSGGRDNHVRGMLSGPIKISSGNIEGVGPGTFSKTMPLSVTINGKTNTVNFQVQGNVADSKITATGNGSISLKAFNVDAPSVLKLYTVDDKLGVSFNLSAQ